MSAAYGAASVEHLQDDLNEAKKTIELLEAQRKKLERKTEQQSSKLKRYTSLVETYRQFITENFTVNMVRRLDAVATDKGNAKDASQTTLDAHFMHHRWKTVEPSQVNASPTKKQRKNTPPAASLSISRNEAPQLPSTLKHSAPQPPADGQAERGRAQTPLISPLSSSSRPSPVPVSKKSRPQQQQKPRLHRTPSPSRRSKGKMRADSRASTSPPNSPKNAHDPCSSSTKHFVYSPIESTGVSTNANSARERKSGKWDTITSRASAADVYTTPCADPPEELPCAQTLAIIQRSPLLLLDDNIPLERSSPPPPPQQEIPAKRPVPSTRKPCGHDFCDCDKAEWEAQTAAFARHRAPKTSQSSKSKQNKVNSTPPGYWDFSFPSSP
ncbi:hypothetical protein BC940DRAFT_301275 [Gongronella butleri]|nr:hypothetical protein BC940DRAFT_301275 [Gongronella butleri]